MLPSSIRPASRLLGVVLAGGRSTRMGTSKALLPHLGGGNYLSHAIEQLVDCCERVACSVAADSRALISEIPVGIPGGIEMLVDTQFDRGPAEGVARAMRFAETLGCTGVIVTPVDLPQLGSEHLALLVIAFNQQPDQIVVAVSADLTASKRIQPLVAIYPIRLQIDLETLAHSNQRSLYRFIQEYEHISVELPAAVLHNVNSPHDLPS